MDGRTIQQYYSSMKHFYKVYDAQARRNPAPQDSLESLQAWQKKARANPARALVSVQDRIVQFCDGNDGGGVIAVMTDLLVHPDNVVPFIELVAALGEGGG